MKMLKRFDRKMHEKNNTEKGKTTFKVPMFVLCREREMYRVYAYIQSNGTRFSDIYDRLTCVGANEIQKHLRDGVKVLGEVIRFGIHVRVFSRRLFNRRSVQNCSIPRGSPQKLFFRES